MCGFQRGNHVDSGNRNACQPLRNKVAFEDSFGFDDRVVHLENPHIDMELVDSHDCSGNLTIPRFEYEDDVVLDSEDEAINGSRVIRISSSLSRNEAGRNVENDEQEQTTAVLDFSSSDQKQCDTGEQVSSNDSNGVYIRADSSQAFTRLSYCSSQEPGESTQVNALGFVDHFCSLSTVNPSQGISRGKAVRVNSRPLSCIKGPQRLAKRISKKSIEETGRFEWVDFDNQEAECNLLSNCEKASFGSGNCRQSSATKPQNVVKLDNIEDSLLEKYEDKEASADIQFQTNAIVSTLPHPRLDVYSKEQYGIDRIYGKEIVNKSIWEVNSMSADKQLGSTDDVRDAFHDLDIGFGTQIAAEAMEALSYIPVSKNIADTHHISENAPDNDTRDVREHKLYLDHSSPQMVGGSVRKSKQTLKSKRKLSGVQYTCQELDSVFTNKRNAKRGKLTVQRQLEYRNSSDGSNSSATSFNLVSDAGKLCKRDHTDGDQVTVTCLRFGSWSHLRRRRTSHKSRRHLNKYSNWNYTFLATKGGLNNWTKIVGNLEMRKPISVLNSYPHQDAFRYNSDAYLLDQVCDKQGSVGRISQGTNASRSSFRYEEYQRTCNRIPPKSSSLKELARLGVSELMPDLRWKDLRRRRTMALVKVCFSQHLDEVTIKQQKRVVSQLGISIASSSADATHFIADKFVRTRNMLEAIALGKPVVTHSWLDSCGQASCFIDEKNYILRDTKKEKEIGFNLPVSLARATQRPLLKGLKVLVTPKVKPDAEIITSLVKMSHGEWSQIFMETGEKIPDDLLILSCEEDYVYCTPFLRRGAALYSSELLLNGIVIQKLEYTRHELFGEDHKKGFDAAGATETSREVQLLSLYVFDCFHGNAERQRHG